MSVRQQGGPKAERRLANRGPRALSVGAGVSRSGALGGGSELAAASAGRARSSGRAATVGESDLGVPRRRLGLSGSGRDSGAGSGLGARRPQEGPPPPREPEGISRGGGAGN